MIHIQTLVIKRITLFILLLFFLACSKNKEQNPIFKDTYVDIFTKEIFEYRYLRPPNPEEFENGVTTFIKIPDTLGAVKVYIQKKPLEVALNKFNVKLPEEFKFAYDTTNVTVNYLPDNIGQYSTKQYKLIELENSNEVFKKKQIYSLDFGGVLQFSKVLLNKEHNRALLFVRDTRDSLDSIERLILLEKINGKWKVLKSIVISFS